MSPDHIPQILTLPGLATIRYSAIPLLEYYVTLPGATLAGSSELLSQLEDTPFVTEQVLAELPRVRADRADYCIAMVLQLRQLDEASQWAARSLFTVKDIDASTVLSGIHQITGLSVQQKRAAEKALETGQLHPAAIAPLLQRISHLNDTDAANISGLLASTQFTVQQLDHWLSGYFILTGGERENIFLTLPPQEKTLLLGGFSQSAGTIAAALNNLHDITDVNGREIGNHRLIRMSNNELIALFSHLDQAVRSRYDLSFNQSIARHDRQSTLHILRQATLSSRRQLAENLTCENIYVQLAHGSELFDSSFRDILVPTLITRMEKQYSGDLLAFLRAMDPEKILVSDFLTHLAWKGKLTTFLPKDASLQQDILTLLAESVLRDEQSLIFFAATFSRLLESLLPEARSTLLGLLLQATRAQDTILTRQVRVILQYYLEHYSHLISRDDERHITSMIDSLGKIDLTPYTVTPFQQWLQDGRLSSLSVFQNDDDGRQSYISNSSYLLQHGYLPLLSKEYSLAPVSEVIRKQIENVLQTLRDKQSENLHMLFQLAGRYPLVIEWEKRLNNLEIIHAVYIYHGKTAQQQLLKTFLTGEHELFAQRGHSYWRNEQLLKPLEQLLHNKEISSELLTARPRFISIGSCGGIRTYTTLNQRFGNTIDILATIGTGTSTINTSYNTKLFEIIAQSQNNQRNLTWQDIATGANRIFASDVGGEYIQPGSLPAILHKMITH